MAKKDGASFGKSTNQIDGSPADGDYGMYGVGNSTVVFREVTRKGKFPVDNTGPNRSQGEIPGAGSIYSVMLNERPNLSNPRNADIDRPPSRVGATPIPVVTMDSRATGRIMGS